MNRAAAFRQIDLARAIKAARSAGLAVDQFEYEIEPDTGKITMRPAPKRDHVSTGNDFDEDDGPA